MTDSTVASTEHVPYKNKTDDIPPEFIIVQNKNGNVQKLIRLGGLQYLLDRMGVYKIQTKEVSEVGEKFITVEQDVLVPSKADPSIKVTEKRRIKKFNPEYEVVYECTLYLIPSKEYLDSKGITPDNPCIELLKLPTIAHGTASGSNLREAMYPYAEVMAETRAVVRAMRFATGCSYTAIDEIGNSDIDIGEGVVVQSVGEMAGLMENAVMKNGVKTTPTAERNNLIIKIKNTRKKSKGAAEVIASFLDKNNAGVVENLSVDKLNELAALLDKAGA